jgi:hypothetical protein
MNENPFQDAVTRFRNPESNDDLKVGSPDQIQPEDEEVFDFNEAQSLDEMMAVLNPGRHQNVRNYAKDRTLSGKARKRARKAAKA